MSEESKKLLREKGQKATLARVFILDIFSKKKEPLNAVMVYKELLKRAKTKDINEVTVYRTLASLEEANILRRVDLRKESVYFELENEHHHHIVCTNCDTVEEFENDKIEEVLKKIATQSPRFKSIKEHSLELFGLCVNCS
jgi:Fur family ferric uptake transcriptional regulator